MHSEIPRTLAARLVAVLLFGAAGAVPGVPLTAMTLEQRIGCQEALARVYWSHRSHGQGRPFAQAVPREILRRKAEDTVLKDAALRRFWSVAITPERLQAELDRMASRS